MIVVVCDKCGERGTVNFSLFGETFDLDVLLEPGWFSDEIVGDLCTKCAVDYKEIVELGNSATMEPTDVVETVLKENDTVAESATDEIP
jgi:hypothetical protein